MFSVWVNWNVLPGTIRAFVGSIAVERPFVMSVQAPSLLALSVRVPALTADAALEALAFQRANVPAPPRRSATPAAPAMAPVTILCMGWIRSCVLGAR